ncbi:hypothetical protein ACHMW7_16160 [Aminobacter sp. UC22_36]|uniref:phage terminase large subunit family protein n=1 Tax=Aminobacter sp. UC22_36 TaxID=3374549 RepID=UPI0037568DE2
MPEISSSKFMVQAGWNDVPHLDAKTKAELLAATPPHLRKARSQGIPSLGSGAIYPVELEDIEVAPFAIPRFWKRAYALDVGWKCTAAIWGAQDPSDGTIYFYAEHYRGHALPIVHAAAIKARGEWIKGAIDPAARGRSQRDGEQLIADYKGQGLHLVNAVNAVESGLYEVWQRLELGRLKVFSTLVNFKAEYKLYRRDEHGKIVKEFDHAMDAGRYLIATWDKIASVQAPDRTVGASSMISDSDAGY